MDAAGGITPADIKKKSLQKYTSVLKAWLNDQNLFPLQLRGCSIDGSVPFKQRMKLIQQLVDQQKSSSKGGYQLLTETRNTLKEGKQTFLKTIEFSSMEDFLSYIGKEREFSHFQKNVTDICSSIPEISNWLKANPKKIIKYRNDWHSIIEVLRFFRDQENVTQSLRELPIPVPTKFIENHQPILRELLDIIIPEERINSNETQIALRYGLEKDEDFRFRMILPETLADNLPFRDIAVLPMEMAEWNPSVSNVIIVENKYSFLSLLLPTHWLKIWGSGNSVIKLKDCSWLSDKNLFYWGDLDPQGFEILHLFRNVFSNAQSLCMEMEDYLRYKDFAVSAGNFNIRSDLKLTNEEDTCYRYLVTHPPVSRIEQERIDPEWVSRKINRAIETYFST